MRRWLLPLLIVPVFGAEAMVPLPQMNVPLKTEVKVKSEKQRRRKNQYAPAGYQTSVNKNTSQSVFLSIEVRNMSPKVMKDLRISYQFYKLEFERSTGTRMVLTRRLGSQERLVSATRGELKIKELKPLEKKLVESGSLDTSYNSVQDRTKVISQTKTIGTKYGGYIVEYFLGGQLARRDASSRSLLEAYVRSLRGSPASSSGLRMNVGR